MPSAQADSQDLGASLRVVTLGRFTLVSSDPAAPDAVLGPGKPLALVLYLHSSPSRSASREHLTDLLWADLDPIAARHALRQTLWYLRQRLGSDCVRADNGDVALDLSLACDRDDFVRAVEAGCGEDAVEFYQGHFLPDFAVPGGLEFEHWTDAERTRLRLMFLRTAESVVRTRLSTGHTREARELARRIRDGNEHSESAWRLYLETLVAGHDVVGALAEADRLLATLREDGREPEPATRALLRTIQKEPEPVAVPATGLLAELVGRERQFAAVVEAWEGAKAGRAARVHVSAPAGLGKTRLLLDVQARLTAAGGRCVYVRANPGERTVPHALAAELAARLAALSGAKAISPASAGSLVAVNPALSSTYSQPADPAVGHEAVRRRALAFAELVKVLADEAAVAILVDDLHWADAASRRLLDTVFGRLSGERVLIVSAARPVPGIEAPPQALRIELPPLTLDQVGALLASLGALTHDLARDLPALLLEASDGSPLLTLESLQAALDAGLLVLEGDCWQSPTPKALAERLTRGSALRDRVMALERGESWLLVLLATAGLPVATDVLATAAGRTADAVDPQLFDLERRGLVQRTHDGWEPAHDVIAEAAVSSASAEAFRAAGASVGSALARDEETPSYLVSRAAQLLARSGDETLKDVYRRWVRSRRRVGDRRHPAALAAELLGEEEKSHVPALVASLPFRIRLGLDSPLRVVAVTVPVLALAVVITGLVTRTGPEPPDAVLVAIADSPGRASTWRAELRRDTWDPRLDIALHRAGPSLANVLVEARAGSAIAPAIDGRSWIVEHVFADSGGMDLVQIFTDGRTSRRLTYARGDDGAASETSWAPDRSALVFTTARWSELSRYDVAVLDVEHGTVRQVTGSDAADAYPHWSPDGSRIAFSRKFFDGRMAALCTVGVDGTDERCRDMASDTPPMVLGWTDARRIVIQRDSAGVVVWEVVDVVSGARSGLTSSAGGRGHLSPDGGWMLVEEQVPGGAGTRWSVFPIDRPNAVRSVGEITSRPVRMLWGPPTKPFSYLAHLRIETPTGPIPLRAPYRLQASGTSSTGGRRPMYFVRWQSGDTTIATVDGDGVVRPRREGRLMIVASAGGWRTDAVEVRVAAATVTPVFVESWTEAIERHWVSWGTPRPVVERVSDSRSALLTRGDSSYDSGVYSRVTLAASAGIGVEAEVSGTISALQWQRYDIELRNLDSTWLAGWDHRTGGLDPRRQDLTADRCSAAYPGEEGATGRAQVRIACGQDARPIRIPHDLGDGAWHRVRLQLFPDGRLGVAIDGVPVGITNGAVPLDRRYNVVISGQSHQTRLFVGDVAIWTGVRDDIDWREAP